MNAPADWRALLEAARGSGELRAIDTEFALFRWSDADDEVRASTALAGAHTSAALGAQHSCVDLTMTQPSWWTGFDADRVLRHLRRSDVAGNLDSNRPLVLDGHHLYLQRMARFEAFVAARVRAMAVDVPDHVPPRKALLQRLFEEADGDGLDWQRVAVAMAPGRRLTIVTGGPGTGKTTTVTALLAVLADCHGGELVVRLAAPTGKAAARLTESVRAARSRIRERWDAPLLVDGILARIPDEATTLHRLLGYQPDRNVFACNARNPIAADVVVVDECSMLDLRMMARLLEALPPGARLVLVGDRDQLASVEAGSVLADLCSGLSERLEKGRFSRSRAAELQALTGCPLRRLGGDDVPPLADAICWLTERHRFGSGSGIAEVAEAVNSGDPAATHAQLAVATGVSWYESVAGAGIDARLREHFGELCALADDGSDAGAVLDLAARWQILCAVRSGPQGVERMNAAAEALVREHVGDRVSREERVFAGLPILVLANDYTMNLFNGDVGVVVREPGDGALGAVFRAVDGSVRRVPLARLPPWEPVFAMTVHKSQGSEFDSVALVLPAEPRVNEQRILTRELLYTGLTRAREQVLLVADRAVLDGCVVRRTRRAARLGARVWQP